MSDSSSDETVGNGAKVWPQGCSFPDGVIHDHGNAGCHQATAVLTAQGAVAAFLIGIRQGQEIGMCHNDQCRVKMYGISRGLGASDGYDRCPACYGSAPTVRPETQVLGTVASESRVQL